MSTAKPGSQHRLTVRTQLSPAPESPFDNATGVSCDSDSGRGSQADSFERSDSGTDNGYILQPRTYTPVLPTPLPSPVVKEYNPLTPPTESRSAQPPSNPGIPKRSSLRQRTSAQGKLPESIQIPAPNILDRFPRPRSSPKVPPDSAYGSDGDQRNRPSSATAERSPSFQRPSMPSPRSDCQAYQPVQASPYSPLQQRPHTSHNTIRSGTPSGPRHVRNQPSRLGGASTLSKVTTLTYGSEGGSGAETIPEPQKELKKKKSAFGWLKKAFALDEDEKAMYEARKGISERNLYYEQRSREFLDGRRVKQHPRQGQQV